MLSREGFLKDGRASSETASGPSDSADALQPMAQALADRPAVFGVRSALTQARASRQRSGDREGSGRTRTQRRSGKSRIVIWATVACPLRQVARARGSCGGPQALHPPEGDGVPPDCEEADREAGRGEPPRSPHVSGYRGRPGRRIRFCVSLDSVCDCL